MILFWINAFDLFFLFGSIIYQFYSIEMNNPQASHSPISPRQMFSYDNHKNIPWNITQYHTPALHRDYMKAMRDKLYASQKKGVKVNDFYVTKRGFYMDYDLKVSKGVPSASDHQEQKPWQHEQFKLQGDLLKEARTSSKFTIYDRLQMKAKNHPVPGVGAYNLEKSLEDVQKLLEKNSSKKLTQGEKRYFHMDTTFLGDKVPGAGHCNPHDQVQKLHKSIGDWKFWTKKHSKQQKIMSMRQSKIPAPATYQPLHQNYRSFSSIQKIEKKTIKNGFGSDARFPYLRHNKKIIVQKRPSPDAYETKIDWKGKKTDPKKREWAKMIWKGSPDKVYS